MPLLSGWMKTEKMIVSPDYFFCRKFECRMSRVACVMRQDKSKRFPECQECNQGQRIKKELENGNDHDEH